MTTKVGDRSLSRVDVFFFFFFPDNEDLSEVGFGCFSYCRVCFSFWFWSVFDYGAYISWWAVLLESAL